MKLEPLMSIDAGNSLRILYVLIGGVVPPPKIIPAEECLAAEARAAMARVRDGGEVLELQKLSARLRQTIRAHLVAFIDATVQEPNVIIAYLPPDAEVEDQLRASLGWMLGPPSTPQH